MATWLSGNAFARPLFALIPDLHGQVERFAIGADCAYVELTLRGTLSGRPIAWRVCDRASLREGLVVERESYFDPAPLLRALRTRPRAVIPTSPNRIANLITS